MENIMQKGFKSADVIGVVQHHAFLFIQGDNTVENKFFGKIKLLGHSGHLDEKYDALNNIFRYLIYLI